MALQPAHVNQKNWEFQPSLMDLTPRFPAWRFRSHAEFAEFLKLHQDKLDSRHVYQLSLATREKTLVSRGTCAPCLCPVNFISDVNGEKLSDGRRMPNWREELQCSCAWRLNNRQRAALHLAQACGLMSWMKTLLLGAPADFALAYRSQAPDITPLARFQFSGSAAVLPAEKASYHFALLQDELQDIEPLASALSELARVLMPGGRLIFTVPFHFNIPASEYGGGTGMRADAHRFGWDLLDRVKTAGFTTTEALLYWSEEMGYLGSMNFIFLALR